jgi:hypothetical protein
MEKNIGSIDRAIRLIVGIVLIGLGIFKIVPYAIFVAIFGAFILMTGIIGFCILYVPLGIRRSK